MEEREDKDGRAGGSALFREALFLLSAALLLLIGRYVFVSPLKERLYTVRQQLSELRQKKEALEREAAEVRRRINAVRYDPFFIEAAARDVLKLVREGEIPLRTTESDGNSLRGRNGKSSPSNGSDRR